MRKAKLGLQSIEREVERIRTLLGSPLGVAVYNDANLAIPTGTWTALTFNSERKDDAGFHSTVSNTSRLTVPTGYDGWYVITGHARFAASGAGNYRAIGIRLNAGNRITMALFPLGAALLTSMSIAAVFYLSATDFVELQVYQDTGGNLNVDAAADHSPEFRMARLNGV